MGAADSKLRFKNHVFRLSDSTTEIPPNSEYWDTFWREPQSANDIFNLLTPSDIRTIRDANKQQFLRLLKVISDRLLFLTGQRNVPARSFQKQHQLNCIRLLTKLVPFLYEDHTLAEDERTLFWTQAKASSSSPQAEAEADSDDTPLGARLVFACVDLLFTANFTVPKARVELANTVDLSIWEPGIGLSGKFQQPRVEIDSNRLEVLRLLLVLCSQCLYETPPQLISNGSRFLTVMTTSLPRLKTLTLICSLLNLACRTMGAPGDQTGLDSTNPSFVHLRVLMASHAIQLLTLMIVYPLPKTDVSFLKETGIFTETPLNLTRHFCGKLHKENELEFLRTGLLAPLRAPLISASDTNNANVISSFVSGAFSANEPSVWCIESIMLVWEFYQLNRRFRSYIATNFGNSLMVSLLYYVHSYRKQEAYRNVVRICSYFFLYLSADPLICNSVLASFPSEEYAILPQTFKLSVAPLTYRDFLVSHSCAMLLDLSTSVLRPTLVEWIYNLLPLGNQPGRDVVPTMNRRASRDITNGASLGSSSTSPSLSAPVNIVAQQRIGSGISYPTATLLTQLILRFSAIGFLQENAINPDLLALLVRAICHALCRFSKNFSALIFIICRDKKVYTDVLNIINRLDAIQKESAKNSPIVNPEDSDIDDHFSLSDRSSIALDSQEGSQNMADEDESFMRPRPPVGMSAKAKGKLVAGAPLHAKWAGSKAMAIILEFIQVTTKNVPEFSNDSPTDTATLISKIEDLDYSNLIISNIHRGEFLPSKTGFEPLKFTWSNMSLGWYCSILWGCIFVNYDVNRRKRYSVSGSISVFKKAAIDWGFSKWSNSEAALTEIAENAMSDVGTWHGTHVKVFKIKERMRDTPTLMQPRGAVDAVADSLVKRLNDFRLGRNGSVVDSSAPGTPDTISGSFFRTHNPFGGPTDSPAPDSPRPLMITPRGSVSGTPRGSVVGTPVLTPRPSFSEIARRED
ncbi:unnamed protein product [Kuraishia capsulata CBS 1993]|uniref:Protein HID1 n=1 Tax=Kuraishia capsulata CBS 1993 TaxID=1382522 RepID=W6MFC7_9ASCO|nr:uncharacterized protein KUCA_T00000186001 [Kuraishia capsulata CBS 1993]CDK24226.1 unnamed protein product [Kuraishia capsulata CBS 1993]